MLPRGHAGKPRDRTKAGAGGAASNSVQDRINRRVAAIASAPAVACPIMPAKARRDSRSSDRRPTFKFARLETPGGESFACIVRDMTKNGARIALEGAFVLPARVVLHIEEYAARRPALVVWTNENEAGLSFVD